MGIVVRWELRATGVGPGGAVRPRDRGGRSLERRVMAAVAVAVREGE